MKAVCRDLVKRTGLQTHRYRAHPLELTQAHAVLSDSFAMFSFLLYILIKTFSNPK